MDIRGRRQSGNIEDRRGGNAKKIAFGGGLGTIVFAIIIYLLGGNPMSILNVSQQELPDNGTIIEEGTYGQSKEFVSSILASTEDVWNQTFQQMSSHYTEPTLVLFTNQTASGCGGADKSTGPFYCPADKKIYLDYSFFAELNQRFGSEGDFASAYVIAHEVGHHVQDLLGISSKVNTLQSRQDKSGVNRLSVMLELQADFLAGYWARRAQALNLTQDDIKSALTAANAIGDDRLQKQAQGYVVPDAFTHGTSEQRMKWFMKGYNANNINEGDTFGDADL